MDTNRGWIFCLNSDYDSDTGSNWGYLEDFLKDIRRGNEKDAKEIRFRSDVYGKPCRKNQRLGVGDAIAFYHGIKSRRAMNNLSPVKPYQLTMIAFREKNIQNSLSAVVACGRLTDCRSMVTCCLSTRFSRTNCR